MFHVLRSVLFACVCVFYASSLCSMRVYFFLYVYLSNATVVNDNCSQPNMVHYLPGPPLIARLLNHRIRLAEKPDSEVATVW